MASEFSNEQFAGGWFSPETQSKGWFDDSLAEPYSAPSGTPGYIKYWTGSAWVEKPIKYWNGVSWVQKPVKYWNGSAWTLS